MLQRLLVCSNPFSIKSLLSRKVPIAPSLGHVFLYFIYFSLNFGFFFVKVDDSILALDYVLAARAGWYEGSLVFLDLVNYYQVGRCESLLDGIPQS